MEVLW